jgi:hypothetical protein
MTKHNDELDPLCDPLKFEVMMLYCVGYVMLWCVMLCDVPCIDDLW